MDFAYLLEMAFVYLFSHFFFSPMALCLNMNRDKLISFVRVYPLNLPVTARGMELIGECKPTHSTMSHKERYERIPRNSSGVVLIFFFLQHPSLSSLHLIIQNHIYKNNFVRERWQMGNEACNITNLWRIYASHDLLNYDSLQYTVTHERMTPRSQIMHSSSFLVGKVESKRHFYIGAHTHCSVLLLTGHGIICKPQISRQVLSWRWQFYLTARPFI